MTAVDTAALREYLLTDHEAIVETVRACAETAAEAGTADGHSDTSAVRRGTEAGLRELGVWERLPRVLAGCVAELGKTLRAPPVAAPPYVAATATGVVLRATLDGGRLVVSIEALSVERRDGRVLLRPRDVSAEELVRVEWR
ncbi:hypothetical protein C2R22_11105 [Salinigranum rubrum]|uniref:DUF7988 domain-containing protein n=1 Tax=Salinigranum rubrum TaxID=755307 RepID=A0A2I8VJN3_9EURY|nr:hypothetical protein [Salinigranum rubrum]AUV82126.1 hypothetical protein C2R22_11105 [Salinigranum rubrum]